MSGALHPGFYVVRSYSHTDRQCLWKVVSRPFKPVDPEIAKKHHIQDPRAWARRDANLWKEFLEKEEPNKRHTFAVVEVLPREEKEKCPSKR